MTEVAAAAPMNADNMTASQQERRKALTDTVIEMLAEMSPDSVQIREVAERAGVALGTLYRYFPAKQHLMAASMVAWNARFDAGVTGERSTRSGSESVLNRVLEMYARQMDAFHRRPNFARLEIELQTCADPYVRDEMDDRAAANRTALFGVMNGVPPELARVASLSIGSTMLNSMILWTTGRIGFPEALRNVEDVCRLVLADYA
ncbi:TetR/AcrR family transcriptional regulator [Rhodococcus sp. NPDC056743]|uniref:TetR/AcrR family transcriptional regulator n=1 Tax=Rhodococcus sp. NPDC056743 TaxID=3345934 RepID=UPI0036713271